ncbi:MAG TPA: ribosome small subunit-dependent GTPase A [Gemmatimonadaceae bacterium]|nr:ribosome small subunit-dependent GTPase A [Gemmatimonadaceae bacterium]
MSAGPVVNAVVLRGTGGVYRARDASGDEYDVSLRGRLKQGAALKLAVGDEVQLERDARDGMWAIAEILPRRSRLVRRAPGGAFGGRVVAANVDQVVVVIAAAHPTPHTRMLDRFLVIAAANDVPARVVVNKADLAHGDPRLPFAAYAAAGYPVHATSVPNAEGLDALHDALRGRVSALTGPSGVGKSSLLNALYPGLSLRVGEISKSVDKGRHTTVGATMHPLPDGGYVMDTPGLREVGVWNVAPSELDLCFPEFRGFIARCRFRDCRHHGEPGCAIRSAVEAGAVAPQRYDSYLRLMAELDQTTPNR